MTQHFNGISNCQAGIIRRKFEAIALLPAMVADLRLYAFAAQILRHGILHKYLIHMHRKESKRIAEIKSDYLHSCKHS